MSRPAIFLSSEVDCGTCRVAQRSWLDIVEFGDIAKLSDPPLNEKVSSRGRARVGFLAGGFPCQGVSWLSVQRTCFKDPLSTLVRVNLELLDRLCASFGSIEWYTQKIPTDLTSLANIQKSILTNPTNINAISGIGRLTAAFSGNGVLTALKWPSPGHPDQLDYLATELEEE